MTTYYCGNCWSEIDKGAAFCPHCGADQSALDAESFVQKLIRALRHPEPQTPIRAANLLGVLESREAVTALMQVIETNKDPFIVAAAIEALGEIGDKSTIGEIQKLLAEKPPLPVKLVAERALSKLQSPLCT